MALPDSPQTREEEYLAHAATGGGTIPEYPVTREEKYLNKIATGDGAVPDVPLTRKEMYLAKIAENGPGGGGEAVLINKSISANGTYNASSDSADGYKKVTVSVPNTYAAGDEGKVVSNGSLVAQTAHAQVTQNGTIDTTLNNSVEVAVPQGAQTGFFEGFIEVMDVYKLSVATIPVDVSDYDYVIGSMYVVATGDVSDGVVTLDDTPTITAANGDMAWLFNFMHPTKTSSIYNNQTRTATAPNITYVWNNATSGIYLKQVYNSTLINGNTIQIKSNGDYMAQTGRYTKFKYEVVAFKL